MDLIFHWFMQLSALTAILELARAGQSKLFEPKLFVGALETMLCSKHTSEELLKLMSTHFVHYCDIRCVLCRPSMKMGILNYITIRRQSFGSAHHHTCFRLRTSADCSSSDSSSMLAGITSSDQSTVLLVKQLEVQTACFLIYLKSLRLVPL